MTDQELIAHLKAQVADRDDLLKDIFSHPDTVMNNRHRTRALGFLVEREEAQAQEKQNAG